MKNSRGQPRLRAATRAACVGLCVALWLSIAGVVSAQDRGATPNAAPAAPAAQPAASPDAPAADRKPGFLEAVGHWFDDSVSGMGKGLESAWRGVGGVGTKAGTAAKDTADALGRLGATRVVSGRERCAIAPNGAPDCRLAAETICKAKGFNTGNSVDYETAENCPAQAFLGGRKPAPGECPVEHVVTKAMCQ